jgi:DNA-binding NtrC family response regulator
MEKPPLPLGPGMLVTINPVVREVARRLFDKMRHPVEAFSSLDDATVWLITHDVRPELVALDLSDFDDANTWLSEVRARCGHVPCIGFTEGETFVLPDDGPNRLLEKPFDLDALGAALAAAGVEAVDRVTA